MLKELFSKNPNIIINTDIDGFLCGMILQKYFGCRVVGFSNSRETIWVTPDVADIDKPIYIDLYVARKDVICIEQHIIAYDKNHHEELSSFGTKINPNLDRKRTFIGDMESDYYHKYPFGTVHYLIALMEKEGIQVKFPSLSRELTIDTPFGLNKTMKTCAGQVILRADDALYSTLSPYRENALDWWEWLDPYKEYYSINRLREYIDECDIKLARTYKDKIGQFFKGLGCDGVDGAFQNVTDASGVLLDKVLKYRDAIETIVEYSLDLPTEYVIHKGKYAVQFCKPGYDMKVLHADNLYSYAFIFGPRPKYPNFSFTLDMK